MYRHLLVPVDGTPLSDQTVEQALALAREQGSATQVSFVHVMADFRATDDGAILQTLHPNTAQTVGRGQAESVLAQAAAAARAAGVMHQGVTVINDRPSEAILATADAQGCDLIFMSSHGRHGLLGRRLGRVTQQVLDGARCPVLVSAVETNLPLTDAQKALTTLRSEHRSLAAVFHGLIHAWRDARAAGQPPDLQLIRAMVYYVEQFPQRLHHPKEERYLFRLVQARTRELDDVLAELRAQHVDGDRSFAALQQALQDVECSEPGADERFDAALTHFIQGQWTHMKTEERLILPGASRWLTPKDWTEMAAAFGDNGDPIFSEEEAFEQLFQRILALASAAGVAAPSATRSPMPSSEPQAIRSPA